MRRIISYFVRYPKAVNILVMFFIVFGISGVISLKSSFFPLIDSKFISINAVYPGASPEEIEEGVIYKIEDNLKGIPGIVRVTSTSREDFGSIIIETDEDFDIEVIEAHHNKKVDAPSGTALMLGEAAAEGRGIDLAQMRDSGRDSITGARQKGHIGFSAIRGGDIVGEHDVLFAGAGERITLRHVATDRLLFAKGALKAARWAQNKSVGEYNMLDVLGL